MTPFAAFQMYSALKMHFTSSYDFVKYNGKTRLKEDSFESRNDKYFFGKLAKRKDAFELVLSNMVAKPDIWVRDLFTEEAEDTYIEWKKRKESLSYVFKQDLHELKTPLEDNFKIEGGRYPYVIKLLLGGSICIETFIILMEVTEAYKYFNKRLADDITWPKLKMRCQKYRAFFDYDHESFKKILLDTTT